MSQFVKTCPACAHVNEELADWCANCSATLDFKAAPSIGRPSRDGATGEPHVPEEPPAQEGTCWLAGSRCVLSAADMPSIVFHVASSAVIGARGADLDLSSLPRSRFISTEHIRLMCDGDRWYVEDLSSTNGSYVNGRRLPPRVRHEVRHGDTITLADTAFLLAIQT